MQVIGQTVEAGDEAGLVSCLNLETLLILVRSSYQSWMTLKTNFWISENYYSREVHPLAGRIPSLMRRQPRLRRRPPRPCPQRPQLDCAIVSVSRPISAFTVAVIC